MKTAIALMLLLVLAGLPGRVALGDPRGGQWCTGTYCSGTCAYSTQKVYACAFLQSCEDAVLSQCQTLFGNRRTTPPTNVCGRFFKETFYRECEGMIEIPWN